MVLSVFLTMKFQASLISKYRKRDDEEKHFQRFKISPILVNEFGAPLVNALRRLANQFFTFYTS